MADSPSICIEYAKCVPSGDNMTSGLSSGDSPMAATLRSTSGPSARREQAAVAIRHRHRSDFLVIRYSSRRRRGRGGCDDDLANARGDLAHHGILGAEHVTDVDLV